ncbi:MAG: GPW/gp25 family protein [Aulosira sp. ZfuVER01]|nr:GPW/gp25 family protein [Aulosira sp. ZfuVER01]MDZ7999426.1 GPW/gp25 family protein [Aulosira sp. DedVER01a]MDZ8055389.1 GPW/gp25 family protein [Aulosira sp. ZfuCHP01]
MTQTNERWGTDLHLLRNLEQQNDRDRSHDLLIKVRQQTQQVDLDLLSGAENLIQALLLRFLTPVGELALLGHPDYGSRLFELLGERNTETNRNRAKLFVLQALAQEPRVKQVISVKVTQNRSRPTQMDIQVSLIPIDSDTALNLVFPFFLEGGVSP